MLDFFLTCLKVKLLAAQPSNAVKQDLTLTKSSFYAAKFHKMLYFTLVELIPKLI